LASLFFFSSRRRHTRFSRDWSSDVCSSDLVAAAACESERGKESESRVPSKSSVEHGASCLRPHEGRSRRAISDFFGETRLPERGPTSPHTAYCAACAVFPPAQKSS